MICGAGNGGFVEVILKKGKKREEVQNILKKHFVNLPVSVWDIEVDFD